jgi:uncharacterized protein YdiU (UPF0061 family)
LTHRGRGRYAYANQPGIAQWNLTRLAETLLPLIDAESDRAVACATAILNAFPGQYQEHWLRGMRAKLGLFREDPGDLDLAMEFLAAMEGQKIDWTLAFRRLADAAMGQEEPIRTLFADAPGYEPWLARWRKRLSGETVPPLERVRAMRRVNPLFIPRNHRVEEALGAAVERSDFAPFETLLKVLEHPFDDRPEFAAHAEHSPEAEEGYRTFCGT